MKIPTGRFALQILCSWRLLAVALLMSLTPAHGAPNFADNMNRPLHYRPDGDSFVTENGAEYFNRPLYGTNTAFRADAGDKPQISFYLPGRGGNLRFGIRSGAGAKWLDAAQNILTRYRPGSMIYTIRDPLLGGGTLHLEVLGLANTEGIVVRVQLRGAPAPVEFLWAYGGANGERASRDGDIGTERLPVSQFFQLKSDHTRNSTFAIEKSTFTMRSRRADMAGFAPPESRLAIADARYWNNLSELLASTNQATETPVTETPVVVSRITLQPEQPLYLALERTGGGEESNTPARDPQASVAALPALFAAAEQRRTAVANQITVDTPDPFINAAAPALCVAADGIWDEAQGIFMHGAVAWRRRYLGWRGAYAGDELGQHDRTRRHLMSWFPKQNTEAVAASPSEPMMQPQDAGVNFARNEPALHSNGDLTRSHYDMNLPAIDILFRHFLWTGDLEFAREVWPVIERHLAWERRLFRRPFGSEQLPLYEAYAAIWASDDLQYNGGGVTHASAYNTYHNIMAARIARLLGKDATLYEREADLILRGMNRHLWLAQDGWFAEWKDWLGLQQTHPNAGLWTFYHTLDSAVPTAQQGWQMSRFVDTQIPHLPVKGPGVPPGEYSTVSTTSWMPYTWSINNVVMAEAAHTSLAYWQTGRNETAFRLFKSLLLDSMYLGLCPGNVGMTTHYDMARGEAQRDFADGVGVTSRAMLEGLFGVQPDALAGELKVQPGFPADWEHASIRHPDFNFSFRRAGLTETYVVEPKFLKPMALRLKVLALRDGIARVTVNGQPAKWQVAADAIGAPRLEIHSAAAPKQEIVIVWRGAKPATATAPAVAMQGSALRAQFGAARILQIADPQRALSTPATDDNTLRAEVAGKIGHRTVFVQVRQGDLTWWLPMMFEIRPAFEVLHAAQQDAAHLRFFVRNNTSKAIDRSVTIRSGAKSGQARLKAPAFGSSSEIALPATGLLPGSNRVAIELGNGQTVAGVVTNWQIPAPAGARWETIDLQAAFNDRVTQIFKNKYLAPRSPYVSLATPSQGIGSWTRWNETFEVDDAGLREAARQNQNRLLLPQGVPFQTPGESDAANVVFTSQWDNYPDEVTVSLSGQAAHVYLLMAGSTNWMQSRFDNGEVIVTYADGSTERLALQNPTTWWPIDQDYKIDDFAFRRPEAIPPRLNLKTGAVRVLKLADFKGKGGKVSGGAATVLDLPLRPEKELRSLTVRALANEVVIGLMSATLARN